MKQERYEYLYHSAWAFERYRHSVQTPCTLSGAFEAMVYQYSSPLLSPSLSTLTQPCPVIAVTFSLLPYLLVRLSICCLYIYIHVLSRVGHCWPAAPVARLKNTYHIISYTLGYIRVPWQLWCPFQNCEHIIDNRPV